MKWFAGRRGLILAVVLALTGCLNLGPEYHRPEAGVPIPEAFEGAVVPGNQVAYDDKMVDDLQRSCAERLYGCGAGP